VQARRGQDELIKKPQGRSLLVDHQGCKLGVDKMNYPVIKKPQG